MAELDPHQDPHQDPRQDPRARLAAWRERGAERIDPVRFRFLEALARRSTTQHGEARELLDARLAHLVASFGDALTQAAPRADRPATPDASPLGGLVEYIAARSSASALPPVAGAQRGPEPAPALIDYFRDSWARVSADRQLREALDSVPANAGPLNTNHLVHGALALMQDVSPGYFQRFLSYVDGLAWLEQMSPGGAPAEPPARRAASAPKRPRVKRRAADADPLA
jgi:hypothetical protein